MLLNSNQEPIKRLRAAIGAGGTGGHIYPGLAIAAAISELTEGKADIDFYGVEGRLETELIPAAGYPLHTSRLSGLSLSTAIAFPARLAVAARECARRLRESGTDVVIGMGGYPSAPVVVGARLAGIPTLVHESNATAGRANKFAARIAGRVALSFDSARSSLPRNSEVRYTGTPLLPEIASLDKNALRSRARTHFNLKRNQLAVFVIGGSLGATALTDAAIALAARWAGRTDVRIILKTGAQDLPRTLRLIGDNPVISAEAYLERMDYVYAAADVVVSRAGSSSVSELSHLGVPAILVPLPSSVRDHQKRNAEMLCDVGAAVYIDNDALTGEALDRRLSGVLSSRKARARMSAASVGLRRAHAAEAVAEWACEIAGFAPAAARAELAA